MSSKFSFLVYKLRDLQKFESVHLEKYMNKYLSHGFYSKWGIEHVAI